MRAPDMVAEAYWAPCTYPARWSGLVGPHAGTGHDGPGVLGPMRAPGTAARAGRGPMHLPGTVVGPVHAPERGALGSCKHPSRGVRQSPASRNAGPIREGNRRQERMLEAVHSPSALSRAAHRARCLHGAPPARTTVPGRCTGPNTPRPPCQARAWGPNADGPQCHGCTGAVGSGCVRRPGRPPRPRGPGHGPGPGRSRWPGGRSSPRGPTRGRPRGRRRCARGG